MDLKTALPRFPSRFAWWLLGFSVIGIAVMLIFLGATAIRVTDVTVTDETGTNRKTGFPSIQFTRAQDSTYVYRGTIVRTPWTAEWAQIIPDNSVSGITVNETAGSLDGVDPASLSDWDRGFTWRLGRDLRPGTNTIEIVLHKSGAGRYGLYFFTSRKDPRFLAGLLGLLLFSLGVTFSLLTLFRFGTVSVVLLLLAQMLYAVYLVRTPVETRGHDVLAHLAYIEYVAFNGRLPSLDMKEYGVFYHPPLYYVCAAGVYRAVYRVMAGDRTSVFAALQVFSLILFLAYLAVLMKITETVAENLRYSSLDQRYLLVGSSDLVRLGGKHKTYWTPDLFVLAAGCLALFWPSHVIHSIRISNEPMVYLATALALHQTIVWWRDGRDRNFFAAVALTLAALFVKSSAVVPAAVIGILCLVRIGKTAGSARWNMIGKTAVLGAAVLFGLAAGFGDRIMLKIRGMDESVVLNTRHLDPGLQVGNSPVNYLVFDLKTYLLEPFTSPWDNRFGRQFFLNYMSKTALFGEFQYRETSTRFWGIAISVLSLFLGVFWITGLAWNLRKTRPVLPPLMIFLAVSVAVLTGLRVLYPVNIDFRYILPAILPLSCLSAAGALEFDRRGYRKLSAAGLAVMGLFSISGFAFILSIY